MLNLNVMDIYERGEVEKAREARSHYLAALSQATQYHGHISNEERILRMPVVRFMGDWQRKNDDIKTRYERSYRHVEGMITRTRLWQDRVKETLLDLEFRHNEVLESQLTLCDGTAERAFERKQLQWQKASTAVDNAKKDHAYFEQWFDILHRFWDIEHDRDRLAQAAETLLRLRSDARSMTERAASCMADRRKECQALRRELRELRRLLRKAKPSQEQPHERERDYHAEQEAQGEFEFNQSRKQDAARQQNSTKAAQLSTWSKQVAQWRKDVDKAFTAYATMARFPTPPETVCSNDKCKTQTGRALKVCDCSVRRAFGDVQDLKRERRRWHPDRFGTCPEKCREEYKKMAEEVFVVISEMYDLKAV